MREFAEKIIREVSEFYGISISEMKSGSRDMNIIRAAHVSMYLIKKATDMSMRNIVAIFERKCHGTVINAIKSIKNRLDTDRYFKVEMEVLEDKIFPKDKYSNCEEIFMENDFYPLKYTG